MPTRKTVIRPKIPRTDSYTVKELSESTWPDFEKLFEKHNGVQGGCWCMFYHRAHGRVIESGYSREEGEAKNRREKKRLVTQGRSHGILVYSGDSPVGWCQFGLKEELPRIDTGRNYSSLSLGDEPEKLWRITCFFVDRDHRRSGVGGVALKAALEAIKKRGGGTVEAYPVTSKKGGSWSLWFGTLAMFEREQFQKVAQLGPNYQLMRKTIKA